MHSYANLEEWGPRGEKKGKRNESDEEDGRRKEKGRRRNHRHNWFLCQSS